MKFNPNSFVCTTIYVTPCICCIFMTHQCVHFLLFCRFTGILEVCSVCQYLTKMATQLVYIISVVTGRHELAWQRHKLHMACVFCTGCIRVVCFATSNIAVYIWVMPVCIHNMAKLWGVVTHSTWLLASSPKNFTQWDFSLLCVH